MKIAIITDASPPQINGVVTTLSNLVYELKVQGHEVTTIAPPKFLSLPLPSYPEIHIPVNPFLIFRFLHDSKPDAVHIATEGVLGFFGFLYCYFTNTKYNTSYHTDWEQTLTMFKIPVLGYLLKRYIKMIHSRAQQTLVTNESMRNILTQRGFKHLMVWSRGVDRRFFSSMQRETMYFETPVILTVSRISKEKNLEAFFNLKTPGTKICVGDGPLLSQYRKQYPEVHFMGTQQGKALAKWFASADVFVFTSKTDTFGNVMLESMACGTPIAAYPVTGPNEIVINGVNGYCDEDLDKAVEKALLIDRKAVENSSYKWSWHNTADIFLTALKSVLK